MHICPYQCTLHEVLAVLIDRNGLRISMFMIDTDPSFSSVAGMQVTPPASHRFVLALFPSTSNFDLRPSPLARSLS
jgi:hypothetical protein